MLLCTPVLLTETLLLYCSSRRTFLHEGSCLFNKYFIVDESPLSSVTVTASGNTVTVMWSISSSRDDVTGYLVYYHHPNYNTTIIKIDTPNVHLDTFTEQQPSQRVYAVSVQALSTHFQSTASGPVTARGQFQ